MGPGLAIKALLQGSFSLMIFGWAQFIMDLQPLFVMITGEGHLHGFSHTYVGSGLLAIVAALTGKHLSEWGLSVLDIEKDNKPIQISWPVTFSSAFIGTLSHVLLDSVMHGDLQPFYPFTLDNPFLHMITIDQLHYLCLGCGVAGAILFFTIQKNYRLFTRKETP